MLDTIAADVIDQAIAGLSAYERETIKLRWGLGDGYKYSLREVGRIFKVAPDSAQQIETEALRKLCEKVDAENPASCQSR